MKCYFIPSCCNNFLRSAVEEAEEEARIAATAKKIEAPKAPAPTPTPQPTKSVLPDIRYQYYQSATSMNISVMAKNLTPNDVIVEFTPNHLLIRVKQDGKDGMFLHFTMPRSLSLHILIERSLFIESFSHCIRQGFVC
jgi:hypothetical protein